MSPYYKKFGVCDEYPAPYRWWADAQYVQSAKKSKLHAAAFLKQLEELK